MVCVWDSHAAFGLDRAWRGTPECETDILLFADVVLFDVLCFRFTPPPRPVEIMVYREYTDPGVMNRGLGAARPPPQPAPPRHHPPPPLLLLRNLDLPNPHLLQLPRNHRRPLVARPNPPYFPLPHPRVSRLLPPRHRRHLRRLQPDHIPRVPAPPLAASPPAFRPSPRITPPAYHLGSFGSGICSLSRYPVLLYLHAYPAAVPTVPYTVRASDHPSE